MISDEKAESAVKFYGEKAEQLGDLRGMIEAHKHRAKTLRHMAFLEAEGTVAERDAWAETQPEVTGAWEVHNSAVAEYETLRTLLRAAELRISVWQTQQASARRGHV